MPFVRTTCNDRFSKIRRLVDRQVQRYDAVATGGVGARPCGSAENKAAYVVIR